MQGGGIHFGVPNTLMDKAMAPPLAVSSYLMLSAFPPGGQHVVGRGAGEAGWGGMAWRVGQLNSGIRTVPCFFSVTTIVN